MVAFPDQALLYVRGFDPAARRYRYEVNQRFGATNPQFSAFRAPVTLTAMLRFDVGPTRERQMLTQQLNRGRTLPGGGAPVPATIAYTQNVVPASYAGLAGLSLPLGLTNAGLPVGLEVDGLEGSDEAVLGIGLNVRTREFPPELRETATSYSAHGPLRSGRVGPNSDTTGVPTAAATPCEPGSVARVGTARRSCVATSS